TSEQIVGLTSEQIVGLTSEQIVGLTSEQIVGLTSEQIVGLTLARGLARGPTVAAGTTVLLKKSPRIEAQNQESPPTRREAFFSA
ncbi:MAG: hypothetical protein ABSH38_19510, partial [Verrucomicrobiota bacterium]